MSRLSRRSCRKPRDHGYNLVETAITVPVIVFLTMLVVQFALLWHGRHVAQSAALDGLQAARGYQATDATGRDAVRRYLHDVAPTLLQAPDVTVSRTPTTVRVEVRARVLRIIPAGNYTVDESAVGPVEKFVSLRLTPSQLSKYRALPVGVTGL